MGQGGRPLPLLPDSDGVRGRDRLGPGKAGGDARLEQLPRADPPSRGDPGGARRLGLLRHWLHRLALSQRQPRPSRRPGARAGGVHRKRGRAGLRLGLLGQLRGGRLLGQPRRRGRLFREKQPREPHRRSALPQGGAADLRWPRGPRAAARRAPSVAERAGRHRRRALHDRRGDGPEGDSPAEEALPVPPLRGRRPRLRRAGRPRPRRRPAPGNPRGRRLALRDLQQVAREPGRLRRRGEAGHRIPAPQGAHVDSFPRRSRRPRPPLPLRRSGS